MIRKKKTPRQALIKECDRVFSLIVRLRANNTCERCGRKDGVMQCSHVYSRKILGMRWDLQNAFCSCGGCHIFFWHSSPIEAFIWFENRYGKERLDYLHKQRQVIKKYSLQDLQFLLIALNQTLEQLKKGEG